MSHTSQTHHTVDIAIPAEQAYAHWRDLNSLPYFMSGVESVSKNADGSWHWKVHVGPKTLEYDAEVIHDDGKQLSWRAVDGEEHIGVVTFTPNDDGGTRVGLRMQYEVAGFARQLGDALNLVDRVAKHDLERFKTYAEEGPGALD